MRGTTPELIYELPFAVDMVAKAKIAIKYGVKVLICKNTNDLQMNGSTISVKLTREETVLLPDSDHVQIQLEIETSGGDCMVTDPDVIYTGQLLDEEALV